MKISTASIQYQASNYNYQALVETERQPTGDESQEELDYVYQSF